MIPTTCPHGKDPRMCAYCDKKDTCDCRCDKNTDVIWGEITGELKDQTDLQAALDKHTADILTADTLAHNNEQRLDAVEGTANEANQRSKDNMKRLDRVEGVANGAQALAESHTELLNKANTAIADLIEQDKSHSEYIEELTGTCEVLQDDIDRVEGVANSKAPNDHSHSSINQGSARVECGVNGTEISLTAEDKISLIASRIEARDNEDNPIFHTGRYTKNSSTTDEKQTIIFVGNREYHAGDGTSAEIVLNGDIELCTALQELQSKRTRFEMPMTLELISGKGKLLNGKFCDYLYNAITQYYGNYDYENDDNSGMLRMLSGENIYPVILSKYYHVGEKTAHAQHFKPWQVEFYDEIQSYDNPEGVVSIPVIRIHIGEDFAEWLVHTGYKGLSEKVSYMEHRIGIDDIGKMPFSIYNASGTKLQEFTLI